MVLLPRTLRPLAEAICERIQSECSQTGDSPEVPVSLALGTAVKDGIDQDIFDVLRHSEDWMYHNKLSVSTSARSAVLRTLLNSLGAKSHETEEHALRLRRMVFSVGEEIGLNPSEINRLSLLVSLHDIGKIGVAEDILTKSSELTDEEWAIMKRHPEVGYRIASATDEFSNVALDILYHHECWDGSGYPQGLKGEAIPLLSRIVAVVDAYDAMTSERPYSESICQQEALFELKLCAGSQFDPKIADVFVRLAEEGRIS